MSDLKELTNNSDLEYIDINIAGNGSIVEATDKIALIDADTIAYNACLATERVVTLLPRDTYTDEEWKDLEPHIVSEEEARIPDIPAAIMFAKSKIQKILECTGCKDVELHFTTGKSSFRYHIYPEYKANRKNFIAPAGLREVKEELCKLYRGYLHTAIEADDAVAYIYTNNKNNRINKGLEPQFILCAVDKDVLRSIAGRHFNYYESAKHNIDMKWVETGVVDAYNFPFLQAMMGDRSDNIIGLEGIGEKKAQKIIDTNSPINLSILKDIYEKHGRSREDAELNYNLCSMGSTTETPLALLSINYKGEADVSL